MKIKMMKIKMMKIKKTAKKRKKKKVKKIIKKVDKDKGFQTKITSTIVNIKMISLILKRILKINNKMMKEQFLKIKEENLDCSNNIHYIYIFYK